MTIKTITIISLLLSLICLPVASIKASPLLPLNDKINFALTDADHISEMLGFDKISIKRGQPYDESKDPALRKSVDKADMPRWSSLIMPVAVFFAFWFVFFRKKDLD